MHEVIFRQRDLLLRKDQKLKNEKSSRGQIKSITEDLLEKLNEAYNK